MRNYMNVLANRLMRQHERIESLQRTVEELREENDQLAEVKSMYESAMATDRQRIKELRAAAITPEMRERIDKALRIIDDNNISTSIYPETDAGEILHDLLKETVEPTLEGEQDAG